MTGDWWGKGQPVPLDGGGNLTVPAGIGLHGQTAPAQAATIADASEAHALNAVFDDVEVETALDALGVKLNAVLAALEGVGITADA